MIKNFLQPKESRKENLTNSEKSRTHLPVGRCVLDFFLEVWRGCVRLTHPLQTCKKKSRTHFPTGRCVLIFSEFVRFSFLLIDSHYCRKYFKNCMGVTKIYTPKALSDYLCNRPQFWDCVPPMLNFCQPSQSQDSKRNGLIFSFKPPLLWLDPPFRPLTICGSISLNKCCHNPDFLKRKCPVFLKHPVQPNQGMKSATAFILYNSWSWSKIDRQSSMYAKGLRSPRRSWPIFFKSVERCVSLTHPLQTSKKKSRTHLPTGRRVLDFSEFVRFSFLLSFGF